MALREKLVRDKIPARLRRKGIKHRVRIAPIEDREYELRRKLVEEVDEFNLNGDPEELADVIEVIRALKRLPIYKKVEKLRLKKLKARGGIQGGNHAHHALKKL